MTYGQLKQILRRKNGSSLDPACLLDLQYAPESVVHTVDWEVERGQSRWRNEDEFMRAVFTEIDRMSLLHPDLEWVYHVANENAHRRPGVKAGVADLCFDLPRWDATIDNGKGGRGYKGLRVELKLLSGDIREDQICWADRLTAWGYYCACIFEDVQKVSDLLLWYMNLEEWNA